MRKREIEILGEARKLDSAAVAELAKALAAEGS